MIELYEYQKRYIAHLPKSCIMGADVGLGKTLMSLAHYRKHGEGRPLLILAPASKVKTLDWQREMVRYFGLAQPKFWVVSYDKFARDPTPYLSEEDLCVIADECHFICNSQTKRGKTMRLIKAHADQFIGLSATPLPNGWRSMENYAIMFGLVRNKTEFQRRFMDIDRSRGFPLVMGYRDVESMQRFWGRTAKLLERDGNVELPEVMSQAKRVEMPAKNLAEYERMQKTRVAPDGELLDSASKLFATMRQYLTPFRRDALQSIIESTREHIVVFYNFNNERDMILDVLRSIPKEDRRVIYEQSGHASLLPQREDWDTMKPSVTLAQYQSASTAIELTYANVTVFLSPTYSYANFHQAKGRTHRPGQNKRTLFYMVSVDDSIDQDVWRALKHKMDFSEKVWIADHPAVGIAYPDEGADMK